MKLSYHPVFLLAVCISIVLSQQTAKHSEQFHLVTFKFGDSMTLKDIVSNDEKQLVVDGNISSSRNFTGVVQADGSAKNIHNEYLFLDDTHALKLSAHPITKGFSIARSMLTFNGTSEFILCGDGASNTSLRVYLNRAQHLNCGYAHVLGIRALATHGAGTDVIPSFPPIKRPMH